MKLKYKFQSYRSKVFFAKSDKNDNHENRGINEQKDPKPSEWPSKFEFPIAHVSDSTLNILQDESQFSQYARCLDDLIAVVFDEIILLNM